MAIPYNNNPIGLSRQKSSKPIFDNYTQYQIYIPYVQTEIADAYFIGLTSADGSQVVVDWGDGEQTITTATAGSSSIYHKYAKIGYYIITIYGNHNWLSVSNKREATYGQMDNIRLITLSNTITNYWYMFSATNIELPDGFYIPDWCTVCENMFYGCKNIEKLPSSFTISNNVVLMRYMFAHCNYLISNISNYFNNWQSGNKNIAYMFYYCSRITGILPSDKLWLNPQINWTNTTSAFGNCTSLSNYDNIPANWK